MPKQGGNEGTLTEYIAFRQPADLSLADRVHRLVPVRGESPHFGRQFSNPPCTGMRLQIDLTGCRPSFPRPGEDSCRRRTTQAGRLESIPAPDRRRKMT
jgi:hypothetical protein